jgi:hypothetical protein
MLMPKSRCWDFLQLRSSRVKSLQQSRRTMAAEAETSDCVHLVTLLTQSQANIFDRKRSPRYVKTTTRASV